jgi:hypothetical protein
VNPDCVVVAHPDDETLWCGGLIARYKPDVVCCTVPRRDPERAIRFFYAVKELGGYPILIPFQESPANEPIRHLDLLELTGYKEIVTHGPEGEYGHLHHKQVSECVDSKYVFGGNIVLELTDEEIQRKERALRCYDHVSPTDGKPKWEALLERYDIELGRETYGKRTNQS